MRNAFVYAIDNYLKQNGKYMKNEDKITFQDVQDCLVLVTNCFSTQTSYENQTKKAITNKFVQEAMTEWLKHCVEVYFIENKAEADKIAEQVLVNKRSRERSERERINIKKALQSSNSMLDRVDKFVDCRSKDVEVRELFIVEGDSALGSVKLARDSEYQAVMPIRGKILNCLKAGYDKIFKSEIITDLLKVLGCGVEVKSKANKELSSFDIENLRWNKVVICTDADEDGFHIRTTLLTIPACVRAQTAQAGDWHTRPIPRKRSLGSMHTAQVVCTSWVKCTRRRMARSSAAWSNRPSMTQMLCRRTGRRLSLINFVERMCINSYQ